MKQLLKWSGIIAASLLILILIGGAGFYYASQSRLEKIYQIPEETVPVSDSAPAIEYGRHIFQFRGCESCHGEQLEGKVYLSDPALGEVIATNLTRGKGGVGTAYKDADWVGTIRHGVRPSGKPLLFMPSTEFYFLSDEDLGAVIGYIKSQPAVDHVQPASSLSLTGRTAMAFVKFITFIPAELIPHYAKRPITPKPGVTPEYGEYLTYSCKVCHGLKMSGGKIPGFPEGWPSAANLTVSDERYTPFWDKKGFIKIIRYGITRHGREINPQYMPWTSYRHMTDEELDAVWVYLQSLLPVPYGNR